MCGLAGYFDLHSDRRIARQLLQAMTDTVVHRGPDASGYFIGENIGLGFRRLSIIDLETGDQPIFNEERSLVLICNGEIYNYTDLKHKLMQKGHSFRTRTDVEVLIHMFEEEGPALLTNLNGQFAFAIYNNTDNSLFLARDHFGICPLYYTVSQGLFIFASEIKAILQHPAVMPEVDLTGLDQVLSLPGVISPRTLFHNIKSIPPGHYLTVKSGKVEVKEYWDLEYPKIGDCGDGRSSEYYEDELQQLFEESVRQRLQADVPVGFFLSGGLDSSLIAAMIRRVSPNMQRHSFSISFSDEKLNESKFQRLMAQSVHSVHHEIAFDEIDIAGYLRDAVYHSECPLKETYNTASLLLSRRTRESGITVVLNGEGSDELFAGYVGYRFDKRRGDEAKKQDLETALGDEIRENLWGDPDMYYEKDEYNCRETKTALYSEEVLQSFQEFECHNFPVINKDRLRDRHRVHKRSYLDFKLRLAGHLIADHGDRMAMANSIEARYPFLDIDFVQFCTRIPADLKLNGFTEKSILKRVARNLLPSEIVEREKFGFVAPGSPALLQKRVEWVLDLLSYEKIKKQGYFNPDTVEFLKKKYSQKGFNLVHSLEDDLLIVVLTFGLLQELFGLPSLN